MTRARLLTAVVLILVAEVAGALLLLGGDERRPTREPPPAGSRLFAADGPWNARLGADSSLDTRSDQRVAALAGEVERKIDAGLWPGVAVSEYSTPVYVVGPRQRRVRVTLGPEVGTWGDSLRQVLARGVPIPSRARPAAGTDRHLTVYQPSTDRLWEFWKATRAAGGWQASWGGAMEGVSRNPGFYSGSSWRGLAPGQGWNWGSTASSIPVAAGLVTGADIRRRRIDHAVAAAVPDACARVFAFPAQRTDGARPGPDCIPEGARLRLDPRVDVASLELSPLAAMLARAAQTHGIIVRDRTAGSVSFYVEDPSTGGGQVRSDAVWGDGPGWKVLDGFPWRRLEVLSMRLCTRPPCRPG